MRRRVVGRAPRFTDKRMQRGVQVAMERKQRPARLAAIYASMRRGVEIAKERRAAYLKRRGARWRGVVENNLPAMFAAEMEKQGMGWAVGSGERFKGTFPNTGSIPVQQ